MDDIERAYLAVVSLILMDNFARGSTKNQPLSYYKAEVFTQRNRSFYTFTVLAVSNRQVDMMDWVSKEKIWNIPGQSDLNIVRDYRKYESFTITDIYNSLIKGQQPDGYYFQIEKMGVDRVRIKYREQETRRERVREYTVKF